MGPAQLTAGMLVAVLAALKLILRLYAGRFKFPLADAWPKVKNWH